MLIKNLSAFITVILPFVTVLLAIWGIIITVIFVMNSSMGNILLETSNIMRETPIDQLKVKKASRISSLSKRVFDICFSVTSLIVFLPFYFLIGVLIKIDSPGPIFSSKRRIGLHGRSFNHLKFRTMSINADKNNEPTETESLKLDRGKRITRIGRFLRKTALDETPAYINILKGDISFIGRSDVLDLPQAPTIISREMYEALVSIRPGLVSLWSISYDRIKYKNTQHLLFYDLVYISRMSFWFDLKILLRTVVVVLGKAGSD